MVTLVLTSEQEDFATQLVAQGRYGAVADVVAAALADLQVREFGAGYAAMAADIARETEATAWTEGLICDVADDHGHRGR